MSSKSIEEITRGKHCFFFFLFIITVRRLLVIFFCGDYFCENLMQCISTNNIVAKNASIKTIEGGQMSTV